MKPLLAILLAIYLCVLLAKADAKAVEPYPRHAQISLDQCRSELAKRDVLARLPYEKHVLTMLPLNSTSTAICRDPIGLS